MRKTIKNNAGIIAFLIIAVGFAKNVLAADNVLVSSIKQLIGVVNTVNALLLALAGLVFIWGVTKYIVAPDPEKQKVAKTYLLYGVISLAVVSSQWAIVYMLKNTLSLGNPVGQTRSPSGLWEPTNVNPSSIADLADDTSSKTPLKLSNNPNQLPEPSLAPSPRPFPSVPSQAVNPPDKRAMWSPVQSPSPSPQPAAVVTSKKPPQNLEDNASFVSQMVPTNMTAGQMYVATVVMKNTGETEWSESEGVRLGSQNPQDNVVWQPNGAMMPRVFMGQDDAVKPGAVKDFTFAIFAPKLPAGTQSKAFDFQWRMLREGYKWFGEYSPNIPITVKSLPLGVNQDCTTRPVGDGVKCPMAIGTKKYVARMLSEDPVRKEIVELTNSTGKNLRIDLIDWTADSTTYPSSNDEMSVYLNNFVSPPGQITRGQGEVGGMPRFPGEAFPSVRWSSGGLLIKPGDTIYLDWNGMQNWSDHTYTVTISEADSTSIVSSRAPIMDEPIYCTGETQYIPTGRPVNGPNYPDGTIINPVLWWKNETGAPLTIDGASIYVNVPAVDGACLYVIGSDMETVKWKKCDGVNTKGAVAFPPQQIKPGEYFGGQAKFVCTPPGVWDWGAFLFTR